MERLQQEQQELLELEKLKRMEFELKQQNNERQLRGSHAYIPKPYIIPLTLLNINVILSDAEERLHQLESDKQNLDAELQVAHEKVKRAEEAQIILETQLVTTRPPRSGERIRRTQSFIPTTKERPMVIDDRVVSLQKNC